MCYPSKFSNPAKKDTLLQVSRLRESSHLFKDPEVLETLRQVFGLLEINNVHTSLTFHMEGVVIWEAKTYCEWCSSLLNTILPSKAFYGLSPSALHFSNLFLISTIDSSTLYGFSPSPNPMCIAPFQLSCFFLGPNLLSPTHIPTSHSRKPFHFYPMFRALAFMKLAVWTI